LLHEHIYLAVILDLSSRKCIGWDLSRDMGNHLTMNALAKALENRWSEFIPVNYSTPQAAGIHFKIKAGKRVFCADEAYSGTAPQKNRYPNPSGHLVAAATNHFPVFVTLANRIAMVTSTARCRSRSEMDPALF